MSQGLERNISLTVKGNTYPVTFPTVGQLIDIEVKKTQLSSNAYGNLVDSGTMDSFVALSFINTLAYVSVLAPQLIKDLKVDDPLKLDIMDANELVKVYKETLLPWLLKWRKVLSGEPIVTPDDGDKK